MIQLEEFCCPGKVNSFHRLLKGLTFLGGQTAWDSGVGSDCFPGVDPPDFRDGEFASEGNHSNADPSQVVNINKSSFEKQFGKPAPFSSLPRIKRNLESFRFLRLSFKL